MTHYMELLAVNQPWNLIIFMAIPVILAETIAITELYLLSHDEPRVSIRILQRYTGIIAAVYMLPVLYYIVFDAIIPLTQTSAWRGFGDVIAVVGYALSGLPLIGIGSLELGLLNTWVTPEKRKYVYACLVSIFLVLAHVAMIFGMLSPDVFAVHSVEMPM